MIANKNQTKHGDLPLGVADRDTVRRFLEWVYELTDIPGGFEVYVVRGYDHFYYVTSPRRGTINMIYHLWLGYREGARLQGCMMEGWK